MNSQGLEALAALASAAPASTTSTTSRNDSGDSTPSSAPVSHSGGSSVSGSAPSSGAMDLNAANLSAAAQLVASLQQSAHHQQQQQSAHSNFAHASQQHLMSTMGHSQYGGVTGMAPGTNGNANSCASPELAILQQLQRSADPSLAMVMQNIAYYQLLLQSQAQQQQTQNIPAALANLLAMSQGGSASAPSTSAPHSTVQSSQQHPDTATNKSNPNVTSLHHQTQQQQQQHGHQQQQQNQVQQQQQQQHGHYSMYGNYHASSSSAPSAASSAPSPAAPSSTTVGSAPSSMPPPSTAPASPVAAPAPVTHGSSAPPPQFPRTILAPHPPPQQQQSQPQGSSSSTQGSGGNGGGLRESEDDGECDSSHNDDKKEMKRAANRRSAQLSRKRKKQFIEELKDENDDLRRKEQILKSIPDLVVVFDSTGKLWFVSQSISRFIGFKAHELEGKSFWERLCPESVRLLKAAFMDSLAARESHMDTVPLGEGLWDLRLTDKDGSFVSVTLNGVVHFAGERPECVCCIRPKDGSSSFSSTISSTSREAGQAARDDGVRSEAPANHSRKGMIVSDTSTVYSTSCKSGTTMSSTGMDSVGKINNHSNSSASGNGSSSNNNNRGNSGGRVAAMRISDSGISSGESESGSSDELNATN